MKKIIRIAMSALLAALCVMGTVSMVGCGQNNAKLINDGLDEELSQIKNADEADIQEYFGDLDSTFSMFGITTTDFFKPFLKNFDYDIKGVEVNGDSAVANVDITSSDFNQILTVFENNFMEWQSTDEGMSADTDAMYAKAGEILIAAMDDPSIEKVTTNVDINYTLIGDTWTPDLDNSAFEAALLGGYTG